MSPHHKVGEGGGGGGGYSYVPAVFYSFIGSQRIKSSDVKNRNVCIVHISELGECQQVWLQSIGVK